MFHQGGMMTGVYDFLMELALNPVKQRAYAAAPDSAMSEAQLDLQAMEAIRNGDLSSFLASKSDTHYVPVRTCYDPGPDPMPDPDPPGSSDDEKNRKKPTKEQRQPRPQR
jgi:hypothetical protein